MVYTYNGIPLAVKSEALNVFDTGRIYCGIWLIDNMFGSL